MKKLINKITLYGYKTILIFTIICLSIALLGATFFYFNRSFKFFNPIILIIGTIVYLVLFLDSLSSLLKILNLLMQKNSDNL